MTAKKMPKNTMMIFGIVPFTFGGGIIYLVLSTLFYYGATAAQTFNLILYTFVGLVLFFSGLWMLSHKVELTDRGDTKFVRVIFGILAISFGAILLLTPLYAIILGPPVGANYLAGTKFPYSTVLSDGFWGFLIIGAGIWLFSIVDIKKLEKPLP
jgi:hypothetical protein